MVSSKAPVAHSMTVSRKCSKAWSSTWTGLMISGLASKDPAALRLYFFTAVRLAAWTSSSELMPSQPTGFSKASNSLKPTLSSISAAGQN